MGFLSDLGNRAPQLALMFLAARQSPEALAAFNQGMRQRQDQDYARSRQEQMDAERRDRDQQQLMLQADAATRAREAAARADDDQKMQRLNNALGLMDRFAQGQAETATDPVAAENAILGRSAALESTFGVPQGQLSSMVPNMAPAISARKKKRAQEVYERAEKQYGPEAMASDSITLQTGELFGDVKPSQLRALFSTPAVTDAGAQAPLAVGKPEVPNTPEERLADALRRGDKQEAGILTEAAERISGARRRPEDAELTGINKQLAQMRLDAAQNAAKNAPPLPAATQRRVDMKTRAFDQAPVVKRIQTMAEAVQFADSLNPKTVNPADDQALIYAFAKAMDPDSVVREGEYATVQKYSQSWAERFGFNAARIFSNTPFLTPQARANMKATIRSRYNAARPQYDNLRKSYSKQIDQITGQVDGDTHLIDYAAGFPADPAVQPLTSSAEVGKVYTHNGKKVKVLEKTRTGFRFEEVP